MFDRLLNLIDRKPGVFMVDPETLEAAMDREDLDQIRSEAAPNREDVHRLASRETVLE